MNLLDTPLDNTNVFIRSSDYTSAGAFDEK